MAGAGLGIIGSSISMFGDLQHAKMPTYQPVDLGVETAKTIAMNQSNAPAAEQLTATTNAFNQAEVLKMLNTAIPDYQRLMAEQLGVIEPGLKGELPQGVLDQLRNQSAAYGVGSGTVGSQFQGYRGLRQLGLSSLQYAQQSVNSAQTWLRTAEQMTKAPQMNVASMFVTPMEGAAFDAQQHELLFQNQLDRWSQPNELQIIGRDIAAAGGGLMGSSSMIDKQVGQDPYGYRAMGASTTSTGDGGWGSTGGADFSGLSENPGLAEGSNNPFMGSDLGGPGY